MADLNYVLSALETGSRKSFVVEHAKGHHEFPTLIKAITEIIAEMRLGKHHIRITFRTEVLIWYDRHEKRTYRALPLSEEEQETVWREVLKCHQ